MAALVDADDNDTVKLISQDNESFVVTKKVAKMSKLITDMMLVDEDNDDEEREIPLPNAKGPILGKVLEFCKHHCGEEEMTPFEKPLKDADLSKLVQEFYSNFIVNVDQETLFHLTLAANYLDIRPLLDLCSARIASFIKGKTPEQIRENLNIVCDFTPEEEAQVRDENKWADDL